MSQQHCGEYGNCTIQNSAMQWSTVTVVEKFCGKHSQYADMSYDKPLLVTLIRLLLETKTLKRKQKQNQKITTFYNTRLEHCHVCFVYFSFTLF